MFSGERVRINLDPMVFGFATGSLIMSSILLYQKRYAKFELIEVITLILILICISVWIFFGSYVALIASILSETAVGIYLIIQTYLYPKVKYNLTGYIGFIVVSIISVIFTKAWSIAEVGFAFSEMILSFLILIPLIKKWWEENSFKYLATLSILWIVVNKR